MDVFDGITLFISGFSIIFTVYKFTKSQNMKQTNKETGVEILLNSLSLKLDNIKDSLNEVKKEIKDTKKDISENTKKIIEHEQKIKQLFVIVNNMGGDKND